MLYLVGSRKIVGYLGVRNSYLLAFILAVLGGVSSFTAAPFYSTIITLAAGGVNIPILSLIAGTGLAVSDSFFFLFGKKGRQALSLKTKSHLDRLSDWLDSKSRWLMPAIIYFYSGLTPLPNDVLMIAVSLSGISYWKLIVPLLLGDITAVLFTSYLTRAGMKFF